VTRTATLARGATRLVLPVALALGALSGCREQTSDETPIAPERNMFDTERFNPESYSDFFPDHRTMRLPVPGTLSRDHYEDDPEVATGLVPDRSGYVMAIPQAIVQRAGGMEKMLAQGQARFGIYCAPCHGLTGDGKGMVVCNLRTRIRGSARCRTGSSSPPSRTARERCRPTVRKSRLAIAGPSWPTSGPFR
jgi:hypothetical protein